MTSAAARRSRTGTMKPSRAAGVGYWRNLATAANSASVSNRQGADRRNPGTPPAVHERPSRTFRTATSFAPRVFGSSVSSAES